MSKIEFIDDFKIVYNDLELLFEPSFEFGLKVSNDIINTDRVNIGFKKQDITQDNLIEFINKLFKTKSKEANKFVKKIYDEYEDEIQQIFLGYSNGDVEVYFEMFKEGESSYCFSYNTGDDKINEYYPLEDASQVINDLSQMITDRTKLIIPDDAFIFKGGFSREGDIYYILVLEPVIALKDILIRLCNTINPDETISEWFDEHSDKIITNIAYTNRNNKLTLNIYTK